MVRTDELEQRVEQRVRPDGDRQPVGSDADDGPWAGLTSVSSGRRVPAVVGVPGSRTGAGMPDSEPAPPAPSTSSGPRSVFTTVRPGAKARTSPPLTTESSKAVTTTACGTFQLSVVKSASS
jgi:hypothetical protein